MQGFTIHQRRYVKRGIVLGAVMALHAFLLWFINVGLSHTSSQKMEIMVQAILLAEPVPVAPQLASLPSQSQLTPKNSSASPDIIPGLDVSSVAPVAVSGVTVMPLASASPALPVEAPTPFVPQAQRAEPARVTTMVGETHCEEPEYPAISRRLNEEGVVVLRLLVGIDGRVLQSEIEKSSGYRRLDEAARSGLSRCLFKPATIDSRPVETWARKPYTWRLN